MRSRFALIASLAALLAVLGGPAAGAAPPAVVTVITTDFTDSFAEINPCTGGTGTVELAGQDVFHITDFGDGIQIVVDTQTGTLTFTPDDPSELTYVGHYTTTFSLQSTPPGAQFTVGGPFNVVAVAADGSQVVLNVVSRTTRTPAGDVTVDFVVQHFQCL